jgi:hypothetical protein
MAKLLLTLHQHLFELVFALVLKNLSNVPRAPSRSSILLRNRRTGEDLRADWMSDVDVGREGIVGVRDVKG